VCDTCGEDLLFCAPEAVKLGVTTNYLDEVWALGAYQGMIRTLTHEFKYKSVKDLARVGAYYLYHFTDLPEVDYLACIPIHHRRHKERGFNQSRELAKYLADFSQIKFVPFLKRDLYREKQVLVKDKKSREKNVRSVFSMNVVAQNYDLKGKKVLLIDDVVTTGATINECARILKKVGVAEVYGLCLAHGT
jgi:competence protein ComFC